MDEISDKEFIKTIADFIEMGHVENIVAMFKADSAYYRMTGTLIRDERFMVRMGMAVLFEELAQERPDDLVLAIPSGLAFQLPMGTPATAIAFSSGFVNLQDMTFFSQYWN